MMRGNEREKCVTGCWDVVQHVKISGNIILVLGGDDFLSRPQVSFFGAADAFWVTCSERDK